MKYYVKRFFVLQYYIYIKIYIFVMNKCFIKEKCFIKLFSVLLSEFTQTGQFKH